MHSRRRYSPGETRKTLLAPGQQVQSEFGSGVQNSHEIILATGSDNPYIKRWDEEICPKLAILEFMIKLNRMGHMPMNSASSAGGTKTIKGIVIPLRNASARALA